MKHRVSLLILASILLALSLSPSLAGAIGKIPAPTALPLSQEPAGETAFVRVYYPDLDTGNQVLISFESQLLETNYEEGYHVLEATQEEIDRLMASGLRVEKEAPGVAQLALQAPEIGTEAIPSYSCYRTVEETIAAAQALVAAHPDLATWIDAGDSWQKSAGLGGYDMGVLRLTNSAIGGDKPKLFITAGMHAREYAPAELVTRFGEHLVNNYGIDADATWILDHHEVHLMLQANPDGRRQAETGRSWRKNTNQNYCGAASNKRGADLNRNFDFYWNCCRGSSNQPCDTTYHGASAASEPEVQAVQSYMARIFPRQRDPDLTDPAPADATGMYIDMHSYGRLVLWAWGFTSKPPPNATALQTLGRKVAYFNGYTPEQGVGLYAMDGASDDYAYGRYGVAGSTWELGTAFFQDCSYFTKTLLPANLPALIYAAKVVRTPYLTPSGPDATALALSASEAPAGAPVTLTAVIDDKRYNNRKGAEPTQNISAAEYYVDVPPWGARPRAHAMAASDGSFDGSFDAKTENVTATVDTAGLRAGRHILFVRGQDAAGNWGAFSAIFLTIGGANQAPTANPQSVSTAEDTALQITLTGSDPDDVLLTFTVTGGPSHGALSGTPPVLTYAPAPNYSGMDGFTFVVSDGHVNSAPATVNITVNPAGPKLLLGSSTAGRAGDVAFADEDILIKNMGSGAWSLYFDGSDVGLANTDVDAFELQADGSLLMSFDTAFTLTGFGAVDDSDILRFAPSSTGAVTAGGWSWYFDGSDVGLTSANEDIDAFAIAPDGRLLISTRGSVSVMGASGADEDLLAFSPTVLGKTTGGVWAMYFDGSDVGLANTSSEDVNGVRVDAAGKLYLTTLGNFSVAGVSGDGSDIFVCTPGSLGTTTTCTWAMYWDGSAQGFKGEDTDSLTIIQ